jgi:microcompartment protein CcmK/EutM
VSEKVQPDEVYAFAIDALKSGMSIEVLRSEIEAANRHVEGMKQRPIFSGVIGRR